MTKFHSTQKHLTWYLAGVTMLMVILFTCKCFFYYLYAPSRYNYDAYNSMVGGLVKYLMTNVNLAITPTKTINY